MDYTSHNGDPVIIEVKPKTDNPKMTTVTVSKSKTVEKKEEKQPIEKKENPDVKKPEERLTLDGKSIEFISTKLAEENKKENPNPERIRLIERALFTRINNLTMTDQMKLMKSTSQKFPSSSPVYKTIRDFTLHSIMDKFVEKKYRQSLNSTPKSVEVSHLDDVHKFVSQLSSDQAEAFRQINEEYRPPLNPNSPEYEYFRETHKGIQATIDNSLRTRESNSNIYEGNTGDNLDQNSFAKEYEEQKDENEAKEENTEEQAQTQEDNKPIDIYEVSPEQLEFAKELAKEIMEGTGEDFLIVDPTGQVLDTSNNELVEEYETATYYQNVYETDTYVIPDETYTFEEGDYTSATYSTDQPIEYTSEGELVIENVDGMEPDVLEMVLTNTDHN